MPTVLVVDDNDDFRQALADLLPIYGFSVLTASSARQALAQLREQSIPFPDAILLDLLMPDMDGASFVEAIRRPPAVDVPIILMTGLHESAIPRQLGLQVVAKPDLEELLRVTHAQCRPRRAPRSALTQRCGISSAA
jgi:two-component system, OmpR family, phosphate regulon response regulator PhoB